MINFFRQIRLRLLTQALFDKVFQCMVKENRFSRYFLYAIGEIVLVVIGILIALQINTWNQNKRDRALEAKILKEIHQDLAFDASELRYDVELMDTINLACTRMLAHAAGGDGPTEGFGQYLNLIRVTPHFDPNRSGYALLVSKGLELITTDSLREAISTLYETQYPYYRRYEEERIAFIEAHYEARLLAYADCDPRPDHRYLTSVSVLPGEYAAMRSDLAFLRAVKGVQVENLYVQDRGKRTLAVIEKLATMIDHELATHQR